MSKTSIHYDKYDPTKAGKNIELPGWIARKKACINIKSNDEFCLKYCILCRSFAFTEKTTRKDFAIVKKKDNESLIPRDIINFPASNESFQHFEQNNNNTCSAHVYTVDTQNNKVRADRITNVINPNCHANLLWLDVRNEPRKLCDASADAPRGSRDDDDF